MKYGLFFGINNYAHGITPLSCARNDAESFFRTFKAEGYEGKLLTDAPAGTSPEQYKQQLLAEGYAPSDIHVCNMTSADVRNALNNIPSMKKGDLLVIFFSGHGFEINGKNCLICSDGDAAWMSDSSIPGSVPVAGICSSTAFPGVTRLFILDCCRNNPFAGGRSVYACSAARNVELETLATARLPESVVPPLIITSCSTSESAYEDKERGQGYFSLSFLKNLKDRKINSFSDFIRSALAPIRVPDAGLQTPWICGNISLPVPLLERWEQARKYELAAAECEEKFALTEELLKINDAPFPAELLSLRAAAAAALKQNDSGPAEKFLGEIEKIWKIRSSEIIGSLEQIEQLSAADREFSTEKAASLKKQYITLRSNGPSQKLLEILQEAFSEVRLLSGKLLSGKKERLDKWVEFFKENSVSLPQNLKEDLSHYTACHNAGKWKEAEELLSRLLEQITVSGQNTAQAKIKEARTGVEELEDLLKSIPEHIFRLKAEASRVENHGDLMEAARCWQKTAAELNSFAEVSLNKEKERLVAETGNFIKFLMKCNRKFQTPPYDLGTYSTPADLPLRQSLEFQKMLHSAAARQVKECARPLFDAYQNEIKSGANHPSEVWQHMFLANEAEKGNDYLKAQEHWLKALGYARSKQSEPPRPVFTQPASGVTPVPSPGVPVIPPPQPAAFSKWEWWFKTPFIGYLKLLWFTILFGLCFFAVFTVTYPVGIYIVKVTWDQCQAITAIISTVGILILGGVFFNKFFTVLITALAAFFLEVGIEKSLNLDQCVWIALCFFWLLYPVFNGFFSNFKVKKKKLHWSVFIILPVLALIGFMILGLIRSKEQQQSRCFMEREAEVCSVEQNYSGKKG